ncbi:hypothetical protein Dimus_015209 [Dionaea muscipula]
MSLLPEDVLVEILSRLPVKTLFRLTCVCKQWLSLIRSPQFATKQLLTTESSLSRYNFQYFFTATSVDSDDGMTALVIASLFSYESFELSARFEFSPCYYITLSDPCRGIFCVHVTVDCRETAFILWNPAIREIELLPFPLPPPIPEQEDYQTFSIYTFGFGYDPEINDYKVFVIFQPNGRSRGQLGLDWPVEVYHLRQGYWKLLPPNSFHESMRRWNGIQIRRTMLHGSMCNWIDRYIGNLLISFDLVNEIFVKTSPPECCKQRLFKCELLQSNKMDGKPRVMCWLTTSHRPDPDHPMFDVEIWELVEYGSSGCWTKQIVMELPAYYVSKAPYKHMPVGYWRDEKTLIWPLFETDDNLLTYSSATKELDSRKFVHILMLSEGCAYIESLVSMKELCRHHNQQEHQPQEDFELNYISATVSVREDNASASSINSFATDYFEWYDD